MWTQEVGYALRRASSRAPKMPWHGCCGWPDGMPSACMTSRCTASPRGRWSLMSSGAWSKKAEALCGACV
jgi:hypothetical protein